MKRFIVSERCTMIRTSEIEAETVADAWDAYYRGEHRNATLDNEEESCQSFDMQESRE